MGLLRFLGQFIRGVLIALLALATLLAVVIGYLGFTASGNQFLADRIAEQISTPDMQVSLAGASGLLEGRFHLDHVTLADTRGKFAAIDDLDLFWTPSELLHLRFHAGRLTAAKVNFDRVPVQTLPTEPSKTGSSFSLPVEIKVDSFDLPVIALGKAIARRDTLLSASGSAQAVADRVALDLAASEKNRLNATAKASVTYAVNTEQLTLDGSVAEPQGGLLARLLALPGEPPVEIAVKGDGRLDDWTGEIKGAIDGKQVLLLTGSHKLADGNVHEIALNGGGKISEFLPPEFRPLFVGATTIDVDARFAATGLIDIRSGSITNDVFALLANGVLDPKGEAKLTGSLLPARDVIHVDLPLASGRLKLDINKINLALNGAFRKATVDLTADLASLAAPQAQAGKISLTMHSDNFDFAGKTGKLSYQLGADTLALANPSAAKAVQGPIRLRGTADIRPSLVTLSETELESARIGGKLSGSFAPETQQIAVDFNLFLLPQGLLPPAVEAKLSGTVGVSGKVTATLPSTFAMQDLEVTSNLMAARGEASFDGHAVKADLVADIPDLGALAPRATGKARIEFNAAGELTMPSVAIRVTSDEVAIAGTALQAIDATIANPALAPNKPGAKVTLSATYRGQPIKTEAEVELAGRAIVVPSLETDIGANTLSGAISLDATFLPSGRLTFDLPDIASLAKLADQSVDGALKGTIDLASKDGRMAGKLTATGPRLAASGIEITAPSLDLQFTDLMAHRLSGRITARSIASGDNHLDRVALDLGLAGNQVDFTLDSRFDAAPLSAKGMILKQDEGLGIKLASLSAAPRQVHVQLAQPTEISVRNGTARLDDLTIAADEGTVIVNGTAGKQLDLTARATNLPIAFANTFVKGLEAAGHVSANATVTGDATSPSIHFDADIAGLATSQTRRANLPMLAISTRGTFANNTLRIAATSDLRGQAVDAKAEVRLAGGAVTIPSFTTDIGPSHFSGSLALDRQSQPVGRIILDIPDANALASIVGQKAEGSVRGTIDIASNAGKIDAKVDVKGMIRNQAIKALVEASLEKSTVALPSLRIDIGRNLLAGSVTLDKQFLPSGNITFDLPDITLLAAMAGQKAEGSLKGSADISSADSRIEAKVIARGTLRGQSIDLNADVVSDQGRISVPALDARIGPNTLTGGITLDATFLPSGKLSFDFPDLALLASMAGQRAEGAIKGTADISSADRKIDAKLTATGLIRNQMIDIKTDVTSDGGAISIPSLAVTVGANTLTGALSLDESYLPSGRLSFDFPDIGLLAAFAGQKADGALKGDADLTATDGKISGRVTASGTTITNDGTKVVRPEIDLSIADLAAGQLSGHLKAAQLASGANSLDQLALNFALVDRRTHFDLTGQYDAHPLSAAGELAQEDGGLKLTLSEFSAMPRNIPVKLDKPRDIRIKGSVVSLDGFSVSIGDGSLTVDGTAGERLDLTARIDRLPIALANAFAPGLDAAGLLSAEIKASGAATAPIVTFDMQAENLATSQTRNAKLPTLAVTAKGQFADNTLSATADTVLGDQPTHLSAEVKLDNGQVTIPAFKAEIGKSSFAGTLALDPKFQPAGHLTFDISDAAALASIVGQKAEGALKGSADITSTDGRIGIKLDAGGTVRRQAIRALADVRLDHGAVSLPSLRVDVGSNRLSGAVTLDKDFLPSGKLDFDFPDLALLAAMAGQKAEGALKGTADVTSAGGRTDAKVAATGTIRKQAIDINVEAVRDNGEVALPALKLDVGKNTLSGALTLGADFLPTGKLDFDFPDVALLAAFAGQKADGAIKGSADIQSRNGKISGAITASGPKLSGSGAEIAKLMVDLKIADLATAQISGKVTADRVASGTNAVVKLALDIEHAGTKTTFDLKSIYDSAPLSAKGTLEQLPDGFAVSLDSFAAAPRKISVKLDKPTSIGIRNGIVSLTSLSISAGRGSITVTGNAGKSLDLTAKVAALPASLANAFLPSLDADGTISATVTAKGDPASPVVTFDTNWQNAAVSQTKSAGLKGFLVTAKGQFAKNVVTLTAGARSSDGLSLKVGGSVAIAGNKALNLKVNGQLPFAALGGLLAAQGVDLKGNASFDIALGGSIGNPSISGRVSTSGATLTVIRQNITINGLAATVNLDGKQARIAALTGKLSGGGTLSVTGTVGITPESGFPADLKMALKNAVYTDGKLLAAKLGGDLTVTGSLVRGPKVGGRIDVRRADITIPQKLPGTLAQIKIKHKDPPRAVALQAAEIKENQPGTKTGKDTGGLTFDLTVSAPRQIFVRGRGIDAELGGKVMLAGSAGAPQVTGGFKMLRGRLSIIGRRLDFTTGQITFGGDLTPAIDMTATSTVEATTVSVIVSGLANNPNVTFSSSPSLPQDEVLALLIFGRNSAELSPVQIAQLADAVSTLAGGQSNSLFNRLRQGLGVDDLDVGTDENGKSNVSVGKYLNKRTYLQLQQDVDDNTSHAIINLDIGKGVKLRGQAGSDGSTSGGVFFDKEY